MIQNFELYKDLLKKESGLVITEDKSYLLESRLMPIAKHRGLASLDDLAEKLKAGSDKALLNEVVEAMTTNETSFFRDQRPFNTFKDHVLPYMKEKRTNKTLKIWCAAASSGQEPYSLAMLLKEEGDTLAGWQVSIKATDISHDILEQAQKGEYSQFEVQRGLPIQMLMKYFTQERDTWHLNDEIKSMIKFEYFNLLSSMATLDTFDVVFCRNVLIYFDEATKTDVLNRIAEKMQKDAFLFLGGAETVMGITDRFKPIPDQRGLYGLSDGPHFEKTTQQALAS